MEYKNQKELERALRQSARKAIEWLTKQVYDKLKEFIDEDIYESYTPTRYERTYEFRDKAWQVDEIPYEFAGEIASIIWFNPNLMSYNGSKYQHGNESEDRREKLAEILNRTIWDWSDWDFGRPTKDQIEGEYPRPFWDDFMVWLSENWDSLAKKAFLKVGIKII